MAPNEQPAGRLILITGGARSGKSRYAQELALQLSNEPVYVATARKWDSEFQLRIDRHQKERDERWTSIEEEKFISNLSLENKVVVVDCVTLWLTNFFVDNHNNTDQCLDECKEEISRLKKPGSTIIIITNEIGMGIHAETEIGRKFTDLQGWMNQFIAAQADEVILMVSGIAVKIR
jgi:adenosylcobinamide kinase/adenosylcobinamide-phosphate guanylyltransferase